ncbi:Oidioi.mRNA.OKI2018_I69.XSR.g13394.t2.cds [Oikopleura dioica]|uniref:Septin n=1 Tax=Oikopleura dioica TaxID=34765 RepID=A0ABN7S784_OIKDI|nr:Oidioi.mRNA.OKI2018_I69.XSR.g13394.t2.cds [Oikopleura dioica]
MPKSRDSPKSRPSPTSPRVERLDAMGHVNLQILSSGMADIDVDRYQGPLREATPNGHVGFDSLPDQVVNKATNNGFCFNILCIGETGIGKSTLMNTLFNTSFDDDPRPHDLPGVRLRANSYELQETNVRLKLTIVDTVGFGDQVNKENSYRPIVDYIDQQFEAYLQEELKVKRNLHDYNDSRIHACLYFIAPTGHSLKSLDLVTMKELVEKVNIIPVIAKSDTISKEELQQFKFKIMSELLSAGIQTYQFPTDDQSVSALNAKMNSLLPFAVVGSMDEIKVGNRMVRARQYPWGTVQVENDAHCDFVHLREMILRTNLEDLRSTTHTKHYELHRRNKLREMGFNDDAQSNNFNLQAGLPNRTRNLALLQEVYENKRVEHQRNMQDKEDEMRQTFVARVKEKENELKEAEQQLHEKFETLRKRHTDDKRRLEERRQALEDEMSAFIQRKNAVEMQQSQNKNKALKKERN